jgi:kinesin family protein 18/19
MRAKKNRSQSPVKIEKEKVKNAKLVDNSDTDTHKNNMNTGKTNILVCIRCRPLSKKESEVSDIETVKILNSKVVIVLDPIQYNGPEDIFTNRSREQHYAFDHVFDKNTTQQKVYDNTTKFLLAGILQGFNATVFAYGATGAGKTYTMLGNGEEPGIMARSLADLFTIIENTRDKEFKIKLFYVEVYNEILRDLMGKGENLELREDPVKGSVLVGVKEIIVTNATEVFKLLLKGNLNRTQESTSMNETSSRSHAILQITIDNKSNTGVNNNEIVSGKFILVDLAGSERASLNNNTGMRLVEGGNINKSLLALGNCINALVDLNNGSGKTFIPWRDSKLTRILKVNLNKK